MCNLLKTQSSSEYRAEEQTSVEKRVKGATEFEWSKLPSIDQFPVWVCLWVDQSGALSQHGTTDVEHLGQGAGEARQQVYV